MARRPLNGTGMDSVPELDDETKRLAYNCVANPALSNPRIPKGKRRAPAKGADVILEALGLIPPSYESATPKCKNCGGPLKERGTFERGWRCVACEGVKRRALKERKKAEAHV